MLSLAKTPSPPRAATQSLMRNHYRRPVSGLLLFGFAALAQDGGDLRRMRDFREHHGAYGARGA
jgi:hypothetical protein